MMKRNILAVVIPALLAAGAANAAEIYNKDGNKLDLYGKVDARHTFSDNASSDGDATYVRFGFKGETQINDQLTGYGQWEYNIQANNSEGASDAQNGNKTRLGFAGLKIANVGSFDYGRNYGVGYDPLAWTDVLPVFGGDSGYSDNFMVGRSNGLATYRNNDFFGLVDGLAFAVQYQGKNEEGTNANSRSLSRANGDGWGSSPTYTPGIGVCVSAAYTSSDRTNGQEASFYGNGSKKADAWSTALKYDANNLYLAAMYGETRNSTWISTDATDIAPARGGAINKEQKFEAVAQYQFDFGLRPSLAYVQSKGKDIETWGDQDIYKYVSVGAYYYFNKNMSTYVDYQINLMDENDFTRAAGISTDDTVGVGLVYQF